MAISSQVACPAAGTKAIVADLATTTGGSGVRIYNPSTTTVYLGGNENSSTVTLSSSNGFPLGSGASLTLNLSGEETIFGISSVATITTTVFVFRTVKPI